tara:strand:- start:16 stop:747 length:732 start_codon:yes stop_codon:yes gene_type:complete
MALPKVATATYELKIPSTGQKVTYRPFLVKEEKMLMMAADAKGAAIGKTIKSVLSACAQSKVNIDTLAPFDIEYFFLQLRAKSIGNEIKVRLRKPGSVDCETENCQQICEVTIDAEEIKLDRENVPDGKIKITDDIGIKLKYPDIDSMQKFIATGKDPTADEVFKVIADSIEYIWEGEELYQAKDSSKQELNDFIESLNSEQFAKVRSFFEDMPKLTKDVTWKCSKCEKTAEVKLQGIDAFFA